MINKRVVMIGAMTGLVLGSVVPYLWSDYNPFSVASILCGMVGGFLGIWLTVWASKRLDW